MADKVKVGYLVPAAAQEQLHALAERDHRSLSGEVAWLIEREWRRHVLALSLRRAQGAAAGGGGRRERGAPHGKL